MDEYNSGMDPEVKRYFRRIIKTITWGVIWLMVVVAGGIYFDLGGFRSGSGMRPFVFYFFAVTSFFALIYFYYRTWKGK